MFFVFEAFHRRPHESRLIAYTRIVEAVVLAALFFAYCVYIIYQVRYDKMLLRLSTESMSEPYEVPFIEVCAEGSTITFPRCDMMYMNWSYGTLPDCNEYMSKGDEYSTDSQCYLFDTGDAFHYGVVEDYAEDSPDIRRADIYWKVDSLVNVTDTSISIPSVTIQIYDTRFNPWSQETIENMIPQQQQFYAEMQQGDARAMSMINYTNAIFFSPLKYRAIRPGDAASLLGFEPTFVDVYTIETTHLDYPLHPSINITRGDYHGMFTIQLAKAKYDVKTEQRQHTLLSALAAAGGAYGAITAVYTLLFGMVRHSPWGLHENMALTVTRVFRKATGKSGASHHGSSSEANMHNKPWLRRRNSSSPLNKSAQGGGGAGDSSSDEEGIGVAMSPVDDVPRAGSTFHTATDISTKEQPSPSHIELDRLQNVTERLQFVEDQLQTMQHVLSEYYLDMDNFKAIQSATQVRQRRTP